jgi:hypothetical protein
MMDLLMPNIPGFNLMVVVLALVPFLVLMKAMGELKAGLKGLAVIAAFFLVLIYLGDMSTYLYSFIEGSPVLLTLITGFWRVLIVLLGLFLIVSIVAWLYRILTRSFAGLRVDTDKDTGMIEVVEVDSKGFYMKVFLFILVVLVSIGLWNLAYDRGHGDGYQAGYESGHHWGHRAGYDEGYYEGKIEGYDEGYDEGKDLCGL